MEFSYIYDAIYLFLSPPSRALNNSPRAPNLGPVAASALAMRRRRQSGKLNQHNRPKSSTEVWHPALTSPSEHYDASFTYSPGPVEASDPQSPTSWHNCPLDMSEAQQTRYMSSSHYADATATCSTVHEDVSTRTFTSQIPTSMTGTSREYDTPNCVTLFSKDSISLMQCDDSQNLNLLNDRNASRPAPDAALDKNDKYICINNAMQSNTQITNGTDVSSVRKMSVKTTANDFTNTKSTHYSPDFEQSMSQNGSGNYNATMFYESQRADAYQKQCSTLQVLPLVFDSLNRSHLNVPDLPPRPDSNSSAMSVTFVWPEPKANEEVNCIPQTTKPENEHKGSTTESSKESSNATNTHTRDFVEFNNKKLSLSDLSDIPTPVRDPGQKNYSRFLQQRGRIISDCHADESQHQPKNNDGKNKLDNFFSRLFNKNGVGKKKNSLGLPIAASTPMVFSPSTSAGLMSAPLSPTCPTNAMSPMFLSNTNTDDDNNNNNTRNPNKPRKASVNKQRYRRRRRNTSSTS